MKAADWLGRLVFGACMWGIDYAHTEIFGNPENTMLGIAVYSCTAALCNTSTIVLSAGLLRGKASYDMQRLAYCAIAVNFLCFLAYTAKISPVVILFNTTTTVISYAQLARLLWPSNGDLIPYHRRFGFLRFASLQSTSLHLEAKKP